MNPVTYTTVNYNTTVNHNYNAAAFLKEERLACSARLVSLHVQLQDALATLEQEFRAVLQNKWEIYAQQDLQHHTAMCRVDAKLEAQAQEVDVHMASRNNLSALLITSSCSKLLDEREEIESSRVLLRQQYAHDTEYAYGLYKLAHTQTQNNYLGIGLLYSTYFNCLK
jgi:hypothetical protein